MLVLRGLLGLHRTNQLWVPLHWWLEHRLELLWCWMICLGNELSSFCHFWGCTQVLHFRFLLIRWAIPFLLRDSYPLCLGPYTSFFLEILVVAPCSSPVAYWTPFDLGDSSFSIIFLYSSWHSHGKYTGVVCHSFLQWITFCQKSLLWPIYLW